MDTAKQETGQSEISDDGQKRSVLAGLVTYCERRAMRHARLAEKNERIGKRQLASGHESQACLWAKRYVALADLCAPSETSLEQNPPNSAEGEENA